MSNSVAVNAGAVKLWKTADRERELIPLEIWQGRRPWRDFAHSSAGFAPDFGSSVSS